MSGISHHRFEVINKYIGKNVQVVFNEDNYLTIYRGNLSELEEDGIVLLINNKFKDKLPFYDGAIKKIFHIFLDEDIDILNDITERNLIKAIDSDEELETIKSTLRKNFNSRMVALSKNENGELSLIKGDLVEVLKDAIRIKVSYIEKKEVSFSQLFHLYDNKFREILIFK